MTSVFPREVVFGSTNREKLTEAARVARTFGIDIVDLARAAGDRSPSNVLEVEPEYEGNAQTKASAYALWLNRPCLGDDTGIEIEELGWLPGVYTARFGFERIRAALMPGMSYSARFVCCVAYAEPGGRAVSVTATLLGKLSLPQNASEPQSKLPYSHFFVPAGCQKDLASVMRDDPAFLSHRGRALTRLLEALT